MWKQLKKLIIVLLCLTRISALPLNESRESTVAEGSALDGISSVNSTLNDISQYVVTDNDVDVSVMYMILHIILIHFVGICRKHM